MILSHPSTPMSDVTPGTMHRDIRGEAEASEETPRSMLVTFAQAVDPLSVRPEQFVVVTATGSAVRPCRRVSCRREGPARPRGDAARALGAGTPQVVRVLGPIFATDGAPWASPDR